MAVGALALFWNLYKDPHNRSWGLLLTGIWLLVVALINLFSISLPPLTLALSVVGVIAGVLLLVKK
jgi:FtsH-binding integral membrane protein